MNQNDPPPNIQMTPVGFGPSQSEDAVGIIGPPPPRPELQFSLFIPLAILFLTLIFSTVRDIVALNKRMSVINDENAPALEVLKKSGKQAEFIEALRSGVLKLAPADPVAARIAKDFFPPTPAQKPGDQAADAKTPAK